ncbi:MAG TPA: endonuclease domain-containing protein [Mucilaginibacter sp.]|jgi:very-short-patch-repair endonuclease
MSSIIELCRELRQRETPAEKLLWFHLRNRRLFKHKFLRQYPIYIDSIHGKRLYYIPDFYCHKAKLVVEADGPIHLYKKEYDKNRDEVLISLGLKILRFNNLQILDDTKTVLRLITKNLVLIIFFSSFPLAEERVNERSDVRVSKLCAMQITNCFYHNYYLLIAALINIIVLPIIRPLFHAPIIN